jgi:hypothetical protein
LENIMDKFLNNNSKPSTPTSNDEDTSLAVLQFLVLARGEWTVQAAKSPFRVEMVTAERRYCLKCFGVRVHDVVSGFGLDTSRESGGATRPLKKLVICRFCGKERYL